MKLVSMMHHRLNIALYVFAGILLFGAIFAASWFATFFILWEFIYGDSYGGRWSNFAWPVAFVAAFGALGLFVSHVTGFKRINLKILAASILLLFVATAAWIVFTRMYIMPPLY